LDFSSLKITPDERRGLFDQAFADITKAKQLDPNNPDIKKYGDIGR